MTKEGDYDPDQNVTITGIDVDRDVLTWDGGGSIVVADSTDYSIGDTITMSGSSPSWHYHSDAASVTITAQPSPDVTRDGDPEGLFQRVERIERALGISQRNREMESKYPDLKAAGAEYEASIDQAMADVRRQLSAATDKYTRAADECEIMEKLKLNNEPEQE